MTQADAFPETQLRPEEELDERYTTRQTLELCKKLAGVAMFDLDVAACDESHHAPEYFTKLHDGLLLPWNGNVWCNPPYSNIAPWVLKAWEEMHREHGPRTIVMLLPANRTDQPWWQTEVELFRDQGVWGLKVHFLPGRVRFGFPGNPEGVRVGSPPFGCVLLVWRRD